MPQITLPDGSQRQFDHSVTVLDIANDIGPGLAKAAIAAQVNDQMVDTSYRIDEDAELGIITSTSDEGLEVIRHSTAHLLAQAVKQLFPTAQVTIGPVIEDGFFYDFAYQRAFTPEDIEAIEKRMNALAEEDIPIVRSEKSRDDAIAFFEDMGENYKAEIIRDIPAGEPLSLYQQGDFIDLCRGPHVPSTRYLVAFKLTKLAGAYWRGDSNKEMLQRVYGTSWASKKALKQYLHRIEEAEKRDHRKIGKALDLFHTQEEAPGMIFWHDRGWQLNLIIQDYMRRQLEQHGYREIHTPQIVDRSLWEKSGHRDKYQDKMFTTASENRDYAVKPMNCPCHVLVYNQGLKSYRDLPLRLAEFGSCHRNEASGTLHGLMRVRNFVQDDAHIFCTENQIQAEVSSFIDLIYKIYQDFGFDEVIVALSTRPEQRVGEDELWDKAEGALKQSLDNKNLEWILQPGDGAFYGPKIDFSLKDCLGRVWQCGTMQVDFSMPGRLGAQYIAEDGSKQVPVMLHRAILGSIERFIGILIEQYEGKFPVWLAPVQAVILNITDKQANYVANIEKMLKNQRIRVISDLRNEKIGFKIREHTLKRIPFMIVVGDREMEDTSITVRNLGGEDLGTMQIEDFINLVNEPSGR